jgi:hypothetical protein
MENIVLGEIIETVQPLYTWECCLNFPDNRFQDGVTAVSI